MKQNPRRFAMWDWSAGNRAMLSNQPSKNPRKNARVSNRVDPFDKLRVPFSIVRWAILAYNLVIVNGGIGGIGGIGKIGGIGEGFLPKFFLRSAVVPE